MKHAIALGKLIWWILREVGTFLGRLALLIWFASCILLVGPAFVFDKFGLWWGLLYISPFICGGAAALYEKHQEFMR